MRVVYVHGVSERPTEAGYAERLSQRRTMFEDIVADPMGHSVSIFTDAPWGHLRPAVMLRSRRSGTTQTFGTPAEHHREPIIDELRATDFLTRDSKIDAAAFLEAAMMSTPELTRADTAALHKSIVWLAENETTYDPADTGNKPEDIISRICASLPEQARDTTQRFDGYQRGDWMVRMIDYWTPNMKYQGIKLRDLISRELATRWADALWYIGAGRYLVQQAILEKFDAVTRDGSDEPIVVLGHSFGALVAFDIINSTEFRELGLHKRGHWALLCLGAQIPIFRQLDIVERETFRPELKGCANLRNLIDINDPLAFSMSEDASNIKFLSGAGIMLSHAAYLDSPVALVKVRQALRSILYEPAHGPIHELQP